MDVNEAIDKIMDMALVYGPKLILAVLTLIIGLWVIKIFTRTMKKIMTARELNPAIIPYAASITSTTLKVLLGVSVLGMVGIEMTSFIAILGAAGLAIGMALSGTLQNFAGGFMILIFKPFKVEDYVEVAGYAGTVKEIQIFNTILKTPDNKTIIIPNSNISGSSLVNYSAEDTRRVDMVFGIGYEDDMDKARSIIEKLIEQDERILKDPEPFIAVSELADSSVNFVVRPWVHSADYWGVYFDMQEHVKKAFDKEGVSIPFPQRDVHMYNEK